MSFASSAFQLAFEISPIVLTNGLVKAIPGGMLPIVLLTEPMNFLSGILGGGGNALNLDGFFAHFQPMPGSTLIDQQLGQYPFANQAVAGNATIAQPLTLSMMMICPAKHRFGMPAKTITMIALQAALEKHNALGGTYTVITPARFYTNCILTRMTDISNQASHQVQNTYQLDFIQPLLTLEAAEGLQNTLMSKLTSGTQIDGQPSWSGTTPSVGNPDSLTAPALIPAATGGAGPVTAPFAPSGGTTGFNASAGVAV